MSEELQQRLYQALDALPLVDSHSHTQPLQPSARSLWDILGYHYYTELAHASGMSRSVVLDPTLSDSERVCLLVKHLPALENTVQYQWFIELARTFFGFEDDRLTASNWEPLAATVATRTADPAWSSHVLKTTGLCRVFTACLFV
jgi:glucuronate isomerase